LNILIKGGCLLKFLTFIKEGKETLGILTEEGVIDLEAALTEEPVKDIPTNIMDVISSDTDTLSSLSHFVNSLLVSKNYSYMIQEHELHFGPCVTRPNKIVCVGLNYRRHADETNAPYPEVPILFNKFSNTLTGHKQPIAIPKVTDQLDYEVELGVVIGKTAKYVTKEKALSHVFGYCTANDLSARDLQLKTPQWLLGKSCDDFSPIGPYLVTADEISDPNNLRMKTYVNGELRQNSSTSDMIFHVDEIISYISQHMTLYPGDIILTGTPEGVVLGKSSDKQVYLKPGDVVSADIEHLGTLTNSFIEEQLV
jgi:2-keto-4-pentenoate hydratase/2-oxohepta-3-ene-1,7-dioic acid hydratase in catechol pathway